MSAVAEQLAWHGRRRASGVPSISVLLGPPQAGEAAWRAWAASGKRKVLRPTGITAQALANALAEWAYAEPNAPAAALGRLAARLDLSEEELGAWLSRSTRHERDMMLERAAQDPRDPVTLLCRHFLLSRPSPPTGRDWMNAVAPEGHELETMARLMSALFQPDELPAVLFIVDGSSSELDDAARTLHAALEDCPKLPAALAIATSDYASCMTELPESRQKALLREGVIHLEIAESPPSHSTECAVEALRGAGASEPSVTAFRTLMQRAQEHPKGDDGARSEAERFLAALLADVARTAGLFELNGTLPIPFGPCGSMEVDLLCRQYRIALELDGYYHFQDDARYRTDRTKDYLLQKHGYLVLRFLSDEVVSDIEGLLARVLDALDSRSKRMT